METFVHVSYYEHPREKVFEAHRDPQLFKVLTPPGMGVVTVPLSDGINPGSEMILRISHPLFVKLLPEVSLPGAGKGPVGLPWRVRHTVLYPPRLFEDGQVSGPFSAWRHRHIFSDAPFNPAHPKAGRSTSNSTATTRITDIVAWELPLLLRPAAPIVHKELAKLFQYRERALRDFLG